MVDQYGRAALHYSALTGAAEEVLALIEAGEDPSLPDNDGFAPLHLAAQRGSVAVAGVLLARGAEVDATNVYGNTPLCVAVFNSRGSGQMIKLLRDAGADPYKRNASNQSPLELSQLIANYDVVQFFADLQ